MKPASILPAVWDVPQIFRDRLGSSVGRQRTMEADGHLLVVLHAPPKHGDDKREGRFFWRQPDGTWSASHGGSGIHALIGHVESYLEVIEEADEREQVANNSEDYFAVLLNLEPVHRAARNMHSTLQEARKLVRKDRGLIDARDRAYEILRRAELLDSHAQSSLNFEMARNAEHQAKASHRMALSAYRLNILAAFFFPLATLSAIFGVNMKTGLETAPWPYGFLIFLAIGVISGMVLKRWITSSHSPTDEA